MPPKRNRQGHEFTYLRYFAHVKRGEEYSPTSIVTHWITKDDDGYTPAYQGISGYLRRRLTGKKKKGATRYYSGDAILDIIAEDEGENAIAEAVERYGEQEPLKPSDETEPISPGKEEPEQDSSSPEMDDVPPKESEKPSRINWRILVGSFAGVTGVAAAFILAVILWPDPDNELHSTEILPTEYNGLLTADEVSLDYDSYVKETIKPARIYPGSRPRSLDMIASTWKAAEPTEAKVMLAESSPPSSMFLVGGLAASYLYHREVQARL